MMPEAEQDFMRGLTLAPKAYELAANLAPCTLRSECCGFSRAQGSSAHDGARDWLGTRVGATTVGYMFRIEADGGEGV